MVWFRSVFSVGRVFVCLYGCFWLVLGGYGKGFGLYLCYVVVFCVLLVYVDWIYFWGGVWYCVCVGVEVIGVF